MAGWLGGWVAGWLGGWVAGWLAGWLRAPPPPPHPPQKNQPRPTLLSLGWFSGTLLYNKVLKITKKIFLRGGVKKFVCPSVCLSTDKYTPRFFYTTNLCKEVRFFLYQELFGVICHILTIFLKVLRLFSYLDVLRQLGLY